jgi:lipoyl-dependent peroxiredoxin
MVNSNASAMWNGTLKNGNGEMKPEHGGAQKFSFKTRFGEEKGPNPEEMIGAALAGCYSMALSIGLEKAGATDIAINTSAKVGLDKEGEGFAIKQIDLTTNVTAQGIDAGKFKAIAEETKKSCPVAKALAGTTIKLMANLG